MDRFTGSRFQILFKIPNLPMPLYQGCKTRLALGSWMNGMGLVCMPDQIYRPAPKLAHRAGPVHVCHAVVQYALALVWDSGLVLTEGVRCMRCLGPVCGTNLDQFWSQCARLVWQDAVCNVCPRSAPSAACSARLVHPHAPHAAYAQGQHEAHTAQVLHTGSAVQRLSVGLIHTSPGAVFFTPLLYYTYTYIPFSFSTSAFLYTSTCMHQLLGFFWKFFCTQRYISIFPLFFFTPYFPLSSAHS